MIKLDNTYSDYVNTSDPKYPAGKAVDASGEENTDGTPLLAKWMNDINGTRQAIIKEAFGDMSGVSGVPDDVENSDVLKALKKITQDYTNGKVANEAQAREQGDSDTLNLSKKYTDEKVYAIKANEIPSPPPTESGAVGSAGVLETLSRADHQHPSEIEAYLFQENYFYLKFRNGFLIQGLKVSSLVAGSYHEKTFPQAYTSFNYATATGQWNVNGLVGSVNVELSLNKIRFKSDVSSINAWFLIFGI